MSIWDVEPEEWLRIFMGSSRVWRDDIFREFDTVRREVESMFEEQYSNIKIRAPKELIREYQTPEGDKVREIGPLVYGYSIVMGPDGKPKVREFGNVRSFGSSNNNIRSNIAFEREPIVNIVKYNNSKEVKITVELPGIDIQNIKVNAYNNYVEIFAHAPHRIYRRTVDLPTHVDIKTIESTYKNGILELVFSKKASKSKAKRIKVE